MKRHKTGLLNVWKLKLIVCMLVFGVVGNVLHGVSFAATTTTGGPITGIASKCLDNKNSSTWSGNRIQLWQCTGYTNQRWTWTGDSTVRVQGMCLDVQGGARTAGSLAVINQCNGSASQNWLPQANGSLINTASNLCLDDKSSGTFNGNTIWIYTCNGTAAQNWNISKAVVPIAAPAPAAHAALPAGPFHTTAPNITFDYSEAPEFGQWMQYTLKPILQQWYPVLADKYTYPNYVPYSSYSVKVDPQYGGLAYTSGNSIVFGANYFRNNLADAPGALIHESTHVIQGNPNGGTNLPSWFAEGMADYSREHVYDDRAPRAAQSTETYLDGYSPSSNLIYYAEKYDPTFVHDVNVAGWNRTYSDALVQQLTGHTIAQLWTELTGQVITNPGTFTNGMSGKCADLPNYATASGTRMQIQTCNGSDAEKWVFAGTNGSSTTGVIKGYYGNKCLDVSYSGTADGTAVWYWDCNYGLPQTWTLQADGSLLNPNSGKCLQPVGQNNADGTQLEIKSCDGSVAQHWTLPTVQ